MCTPVCTPVYTPLCIPVCTPVRDSRQVTGGYVCPNWLDTVIRLASTADSDTAVYWASATADTTSLQVVTSRHGTALVPQDLSRCCPSTATAVVSCHVKDTENTS